MFSIIYFNCEINEDELIKELKVILNQKLISEFDISFINSIIDNLPKFHNLTTKQEKYIKSILTKYSINYLKKNDFKEIDVTVEMIFWAKSEIAAFEKTRMGNWRYSGVKAWRGLIGEKLVYQWLKSIFPNIISNLNLSQGDYFDEFDCIVNEKKMDIKCATEWWYTLITPKVKTVKMWPKNYYIGCRYDDRTVPNKLIIFGWISSEDIEKFPITRDKGTDYYEVPIYELKDIKLLVDMLK